MFREPPHVFLDSSVVLAGCASSSGASRLILEAAMEKKIIAHVSRVVLKECERNLTRKFSKQELLFFYQWVGKAPLVLEELPSEEELEKFQDLIASKDVHVLATAVCSKVDFLTTLDKKHFFTPGMEMAKLPLAVKTPGELVRLILKKC